LEELGNGKGLMAEASEEGQDPRRAVEPMIIIIIFFSMMSLAGSLGTGRMLPASENEKLFSAS
jgi:hypothetical protein